MGRNTKDKMPNRNRIQSQEEYEEAIAKLEQYRAEYEWIKSTDRESAIKEINEEAMKIRGMINGERSSEQLYYLCRYNELTRKKYEVQNGQYMAVINEKIMALVAKIKQYEIDSKEYTITDIVKSWIGKDDETREARRMNRLLMRVRIDGIPNDVDLSLQSPDQIIEHMKKYGDFVGITLPDKQSTSKELTVSEGYLTKAQREYFDFVNQAILNPAEKPFADAIDARDTKTLAETLESEKGDSHENVRKAERIDKPKDESKPKDDKGEIEQ